MHTEFGRFFEESWEFLLIFLSGYTDSSLTQHNSIGFFFCKNKLKWGKIIYILQSISKNLVVYFLLINNKENGEYLYDTNVSQQFYINLFHLITVNEGKLV